MKNPAFGGVGEKRLAANFSINYTRAYHKNQSFLAVNAAALVVLPALLNRWLPNGKVQGAEYIALNPCRADRKAGSFKVNIRTGRWADFATGHSGGDIVSLAAYLSGKKQYEAMQELAQMLGVNHG